MKKVAEVRELWRPGPQLLAATQEADNPPSSSSYNLAEFSLWQTSRQNRLLVGPGRLSTAYTGMLRLLASPDQLAARTAEMLPADHSRTATEEEKEGEAVEVVVAEGRMANSIRNYFMPTASQQQEEGIRQPHRYGQFCEFDLDSNTCIK